jgi:hypothetical protein
MAQIPQIRRQANAVTSESAYLSNLLSGRVYAISTARVLRVSVRRYGRRPMIRVAKVRYSTRFTPRCLEHRVRPADGEGAQKARIGSIAAGVGRKPSSSKPPLRTRRPAAGPMERRRR